MAEPLESVPEEARRRPWWVGALVPVAVYAILLMLVGQLFLDGWSDLLPALGGAIGAALALRSPWGQRYQRRRSKSTSRWHAGRPEERWH